MLSSSLEKKRSMQMSSYPTPNQLHAKVSKYGRQRKRANYIAITVKYQEVAII